MFFCSHLSIVVLSFLALSLGGPLKSKNHFNVNILQPNFTDVADRSFTVAVTMGMDLLGGGVLVSQRFVLTAASIINGLNMTDLRVRLGSNSAYQGGRHHRVHDVIPHPKYTNNDTAYNLALMRLDRNVSYQIARHISFLSRVPFVNDMTFGNITGFGQDSFGELTGDVGLELTRTQLYSKHFCTNNWRDISLPSTHFCGWSKNNSAPCFGDIGDPVTKCVSDRRCELLGIYAGTNLCGAEPLNPQTYLDIGQFRDWVKDIIRQNYTDLGIEDPLSDEFE